MYHELMEALLAAWLLEDNNIFTNCWHRLRIASCNPSRWDLWLLNFHHNANGQASTITHAHISRFSTLYMRLLDAEAREKVPKHVETNAHMGRTNVVRFVRISIEIVGSVLASIQRATKFFSAALSASHSYNDFRV